MKNLKPDYFFDLQSFKHADLFKDLPFVWEALTRIESYLKAISLGKIESLIPNGVFLIDPHLISIGKETTIEPGVYIKGPCIIGDQCSVRHGAYIRGNVIAGDRCVIGHDTEAKNAILLDHAHAAHFAYLGDTILGNHVNLGAGTKCANLKLNSDPVTIDYLEQNIETGLRKFGAIIGDFSQTGCNAVTNPGTLIGQNVICYPCMNIGGFIPSDSLVKTNTQTRIVSRNPKKH